MHIPNYRPYLVRKFSLPSNKIMTLLLYSFFKRRKKHIHIPNIQLCFLHILKYVIWKIILNIIFALWILYTCIFTVAKKKNTYSRTLFKQVLTSEQQKTATKQIHLILHTKHMIPNKMKTSSDANIVVPKSKYK